MNWLASPLVKCEVAVVRCVLYLFKWPIDPFGLLVKYIRHRTTSHLTFNKWRNLFDPFTYLACQLDLRCPCSRDTKQYARLITRCTFAVRCAASAVYHAG